MFNTFIEFKEKYIQKKENDEIVITKDPITHRFEDQIFTSSVSKILKIVVEGDEIAFKTLKQASKFIKNPEDADFEHNQLRYTNKFILMNYGREYKIFKKIIEKGGLVNA